MAFLCSFLIAINDDDLNALIIFSSDWVCNKTSTDSTQSLHTRLYHNKTTIKYALLSLHRSGSVDFCASCALGIYVCVLLSSVLVVSCCCLSSTVIPTIYCVLNLWPFQNFSIALACHHLLFIIFPLLALHTGVSVLFSRYIPYTIYTIPYGIFIYVLYIWYTYIYISNTSMVYL